MNEKLFENMRKQMTPSPQVRAALDEKLAQPVKKRPVPWKRYGALAACAALVIGGLSVYSLRQDPTRWMLLTQNFHHDVLEVTDPHDLHSYVTVDGPTVYVQESAETITAGVGVRDSEGGEGDQDVDMTVSELEEIMLSYGFTEEEIKEYQSLGYQMTWAKWWQFIHQQQNSEGSDPFNLDALKSFSQKELYVNTGAIRDGAYIGDAPSQEEAVNAYQKLMDRFSGTYPDWYGGAYINDSGWLVVQLVEDKDPADKSLELQVLDWTGGDHMMFSSCKYSLSYLHHLQDKVCDAMIELGLFSSCGTNEERSRLDLTLTSVTNEALALLAELDPDDDAIYVQVGQRASHDLGEDVRTDSAKTEDPAVHYAVPGGAAAPDISISEDNAIAEEPWYDGARYDIRDLPEDMKPSATDSVPEEDLTRPVQGGTSSFTPAYDPDAGFLYPKE